VLTNTHVVTLDGATGSGTIQVTTSDGKLYSADIVGTDPTDDLAVIKLKNAKGLTPIEYGDSDKVNVGSTVVAIGAPLGLSNTVTDGIVSAVNRSISIASSAAPNNSDQSNGSNGQGGNSPFDFWDNGSSGNSGATSTISVPVIQTDASINPGNSGGALLDDSGKLIGINVAIASTGSSSGSSSGQSGSIGVGFAIPVNVAERIAKEIIADGKATHGLLGASVSDATADTSSTVGAVIAESPSGNGAAAAAGLQKGDVVTQFDGKPITGATDLTAQVRALAGGASAKLTYVRDGNAHEVTVKLGTYQS
jgi:putative serine protease PepD